MGLKLATYALIGQFSNTSISFDQLLKNVRLMLKIESILELTIYSFVSTSRRDRYQIVDGDDSHLVINNHREHMYLIEDAISKDKRPKVQVSGRTPHVDVGGQNMDIAIPTKEIHNADFHVTESNKFEVIKDLAHNTRLTDDWRSEDDEDAQDDLNDIEDCLDIS